MIEVSDLHKWHFKFSWQQGCSENGWTVSIGAEGMASVCDSRIVCFLSENGMAWKWLYARWYFFNLCLGKATEPWFCLLCVENCSDWHIKVVFMIIERSPLTLLQKAFVWNIVERTELSFEIFSCFVALKINTAQLIFYKYYFVTLNICTVDSKFYILQVLVKILFEVHLIFRRCCVDCRFCFSASKGSLHKLQKRSFFLFKNTGRNILL